jgi:CheY-like chemotaxis protein
MTRKTVLLVEDDGDIRDALQDLLEEDGFDVVPASNGHQALEFLRLSRPVRPQLVLLDLAMPIVDGRQVLEAMRAEADLADIPVIVVSAVARDKPIGATAFVRKPVSAVALLQMVRASAAAIPAPARDPRLQ